MSVLILSTNFVRHFSLYKNSVRYHRLACLHVKYPLLLSDLNRTWIFSTDFQKNPQIWNFMEIRPVGAELLYADRQTDMKKLPVAFRNFANAPKIHKYAISIKIPISAMHRTPSNPYSAKWLHMTATQFYNCYTTQVIYLRVQFHLYNGD
jgi:hypothetical protein